MTDRLELLVQAAAETAEGMSRTAEGKADATPLHSDARTFRGIASMLTGLSTEAQRREETTLQFRRILQRIAMLEVRGAQQMVEAGDWKSLVEEVQAIAHEVLHGPATSRRERRPPQGDRT